MVEFIKARELSKRLLGEVEKKLGSSHPSTQMARAGLAYLFKELGEYGKAKELYEQVLAVQEKNLGPQHPSTLSTQQNLTNVREKLGE